MGAPLVRLESSSWLGLLLMRQGKRLLVHMVNYHGTRPYDKNNVCMDQIVLVKDVTIEIARARPASVKLEPGAEAAPCL